MWWILPYGCLDFGFGTLLFVFGCLGALSDCGGHSGYLWFDLGISV